MASDEIHVGSVVSGPLLPEPVEVLALVPMGDAVKLSGHRPQGRGRSMNRLQRDVVILTLLEELKSRGSWCGETHLQKTTYFLQELLLVPLGFKFVLYKHGPYSFDLSDEVTALRADLLLTVKPNPPYGPSLLPAPESEALIQRFARTRRTYEGSIRFVAEWLASKNVTELEKLGTALYVSNMGSEERVDTRAERVHELKPHVRLEEAREALQTVDQMSAAARELIPA
jgi:uncharacterized protein YwgA